MATLNYNGKKIESGHWYVIWELAVFIPTLQKEGEFIVPGYVYDLLHDAPIIDMVGNTIDPSKAGELNPLTSHLVDKLNDYYGLFSRQKIRADEMKDWKSYIDDKKSKIFTKTPVSTGGALNVPINYVSTMRFGSKTGLHQYERLERSGGVAVNLWVYEASPYEIFLQRKSFDHDTVLYNDQKTPKEFTTFGLIDRQDGYLCFYVDYSSTQGSYTDRKVKDLHVCRVVTNSSGLVIKECFNLHKGKWTAPIIPDADHQVRWAYDVEINQLPVVDPPIETEETQRDFEGFIFQDEIIACNFGQIERYELLSETVSINTIAEMLYIDILEINKVNSIYWGGLRPVDEVLIDIYNHACVALVKLIPPNKRTAKKDFISKYQSVNRINAEMITEYFINYDLKLKFISFEAVKDMSKYHVLNLINNSERNNAGSYSKICLFALTMLRFWSSKKS